MDPDLLHFDGYQGVSLSDVTAHHPQQTHQSTHSKPCGVLDPLKYRAVSCMDISMYSGGRSLGLQETRNGEMLYTRSSSAGDRISS